MKNCKKASAGTAPAPVRIGFDAKRAAQNRTGLGNYSRFVIRILSEQEPHNEYHLYAPDERRTPFFGEIPTLGRLMLHFPAGRVWRLLRRLWRVWGMAADVKRDAIDIFHGLSNELPLGIERTGCRTVVTIHDLIFLHCPEYYHRIDRMIYNRKFRRACRTADRVIAVSEYTKREIMRYYGTPEEKIDVVYQGCDPVFGRDIDGSVLRDVSRRHGLPPRFLLYVGSIEERKNLMLVAKALDVMQERHSLGRLDVHVVAVGRRTKYTDKIEAYLRRTGLESRFHFFHNVSYADLPSFYRLATAFVYPSRIEGFGIPLLEAVTSGLPAIGCTGSCLEEAGGPGSIYVAPDDSRQMAEAIERLWTDGPLRQRMAAQGRQYALNFTDERLCRGLMDVYGKLG